ncbi:hypothetical protein B0H16DRAFT_1688290 [Mycena metata]|uniref:Uncharacterized protein n=1 Tax=Mycena metata TaxID=1033252 RepID=A0AAD7JF62_9AGAR|nr:hypothetical protein B0H16DRAFT_1688290 [Mycena metata]
MINPTWTSTSIISAVFCSIHPHISRLLLSVSPFNCSNPTPGLWTSSVQVNLRWAAGGIVNKVTSKLKFTSKYTLRLRLEQLYSRAPLCPTNLRGANKVFGFPKDQYVYSVVPALSMPAKWGGSPGRRGVELQECLNTFQDLFREVIKVALVLCCIDRTVSR